MTTPKERAYSLNVVPDAKTNGLILKNSDLASENYFAMDQIIDTLTKRSSLSISNADSIIYDHWFLCSKNGLSPFKDCRKITSTFWLLNKSIFRLVTY